MRTYTYIYIYNIIIPNDVVDGDDESLAIKTGNFLNIQKKNQLLADLKPYAKLFVSQRY